MDDTKADAPLTPDEERALREAWPRTAKALRAMAQRANTARGASWEHGAMCATHLLNAVDAVGRLLTTLDEVRAERSAATRAIDDLRADAGTVISDLHRANQLGREVRQAAIERVIAARLERDEAVEALAELRAGAGTVISDLHRANQLGPCGEVRQVAIERAIAALRAAVLGGDQ